ncbi:MAG: transcription elongation factor GreB [Sandaracinus sp.]|nr:transcription elongation factor GreB [Sandaracinus sp.]
MTRRARTARPKGSAYITPEGYERYRAELAHLWQVERPKVTQGVADAAAEGDRSENAEYIYGKKKLREIDRRIRFLSTRLDELKVVENGERSEATKVFFGAWVRVEDEEGNEKVYRIVGPDEHDMDPRYVSMDGPLGRALLGKRLDDEVLVRRPKGDIDVVIVEIGYEPLD